MKLAFVHRRYGIDGGTERFLETLTRRLAEREHEIVVYASSVDPRFGRTKLARFVGLGPAWMGAIGLWLLAALRVRRGRHDAVMHLGRTGPLDVYRAGGGCHRRWYELARAAAATPLARLSLAVSLGHRFRLWHERRAVLGGGLVVVPSQTARQDLVDAYGAAAESVRVLHNGVDLDRFNPRVRQLFFEEERRRLGLRPEELVLLFVGSDFHRKGLDTVLRATAELRREDEAGDLRLLVIGSDRRRPVYEQLAEELGVRDCVTFLRHHDAPERAYAAADAFVLPTRHDPFANVTLEALATGLPVVTTRCNGATEVMGDCPALAVIDDPGDAESVTASLRAFLATEGLQERRAAARASAEACGDVAAVTRWEELLQEVVSSRGAGV